MSKTPHKAKRKGVSVRSRAARRAVSPLLPKKQNPTTSETTYTSGANVTTYTQPQGIRKKKKQQQTRAQKKRLEKTLDRALVVMEQREVKVSKSESKLKAVRERRKGWEDINGERKKKALDGSRFDVLLNHEDQKMEDEKVSELPLRMPIQGKSINQKRRKQNEVDEEEEEEKEEEEDIL